MKIIGFLAVCSDWITIGRNGGLPWGDPLPADMRRFRRLTMGKPVIYGRRTLESMGGPLRGRTNIVLSRQHTKPWFAIAADSIAGALMAADQSYESMTDPAGECPLIREAFIIGGAQVFERTWGLMDEIYLTVVSCPVEGETDDARVDLSFLSGPEWGLESTDDQRANHNNMFHQHFHHYVRKD